MRRIITLLIGILYLSNNLNAQKLDYDNNSNWFWTLNSGATWHTSDVQNKPSAAFGLTVGRSLNYAYAKKISFDVRGRLLGGSWVGLDKKRTDFAVPNEALSSGETNYKDSLGYAFRNFKTATTELSLELVMHFNSVKERTRFDPYIFGGIGYTWFRAKGDYLNSGTFGDEMYDFASWDENLKNKQYLLLKDLKYESYLDGSGSKRNGKIMPSLGFGIGYQVAPRFSIGIEHKTTFTGLDIFDGVADKSGSIKNDWYHYTSFYLRFYLKSHQSGNYGNSNSSNNGYTDQNDAMQPPVVSYLNPATPGTTVSSPTFQVIAKIKNVAGRDDITFSHNGRQFSKFNFKSSREFDAYVTLTEGENIFEITGSNVYGTDRQSTTVIYKKPDPVSPLVSFQNPYNTPQTVTTNEFNLEATVLNVDQKSQVTFQFNGGVQNNFTFNTTTKKVRQILDLRAGVNTVQITGVNAVGTDSKTVTIIYNPVYVNPNPVRQPPVVYFVTPARSPYTATSTTMMLDAKVLHVVNKQNVTFKQNGQYNSIFSFNPSNADFRANVTLNSGQNVFEIIGTNQDGTAQATTIVVYERAAYNPPIVTIVNPNVNPYTSNQESFNLIATVLNVSAKNQVELRINGQLSNNFTFINSTVSAQIRLSSGTTVFEVKGTNSDGVDQKATTVIYGREAQQNRTPPIVTITSPNVNPFNSKQENLKFTATVLNVTSKAQVEMKINGQIISDFTYSNSFVQANILLGSGTTNIEIKGTNQDGLDQKSTTVIYRKPIAYTPKPPVVTIIAPNSNPYPSREENVNFSASVLNVSSKSQVELKVNGQVTTNFEFNNNTVQANISLADGTTTIDVKGTNQDGVDQKQTTITYRKPIVITRDKPVIVFTNPARCPASFNEGANSIKGYVLNVQSEQEVVFKVGGTVVSNVTSEMTDGKLMFTIPLKVSFANGDLAIEVTATNEAGSDVKSCLIKPIKTIVTPVIKPTGVTPPKVPTTREPDKPIIVAPPIVVPASPDRKPKVNPNGGPGRNGTRTPKP